LICASFFCDGHSLYTDVYWLGYIIVNRLWRKDENAHFRWKWVILKEIELCIITKVNPFYSAFFI
jgi:hypothetical protein